MRITKEKTTSIGIGIQYTTLSDLQEYKKAITLTLPKRVITFYFKRNKHPLKDYATELTGESFPDFIAAYNRRAEALNLPDPLGGWVCIDDVLKYYDLPTYSGDKNDTENIK